MELLITMTDYLWSLLDFQEKTDVLFLRHFVDYDGPDNGRFTFNAIISDADLR